MVGITDNHDMTSAVYHELKATVFIYDITFLQGLREGCILHVEGNQAVVKGSTCARLFIR